MEEKGIVRSIRGDKETFERLADITKANFANQGEALNALINAWDLQQAKTAIPTRKAELDDFDAHLQALSTAYLHSLQIAESAETRAQNALDAEIRSKDALIRDLQAQLETAKTAAQVARNAERQAETETANLQKALETAERQATDAAQAVADKQGLIDALQQQLDGAKAKADANAKAADRAITAEAMQAAAEAEASRLKNQLEIDKVLADAALSKAVAEAERKAARDAAELQETANATITGLYQQINQLMERVTAAEAKADAATAPDPAPTNDQQTKPAKPPRKKAAVKKADDAPTGDAATMRNANAEKN